MDDKFFEDMAAGDEYRSAGATLSEAAIIDFAMHYDPQPFHRDKTAAEESIYGGLIASGWQVAAIAFRLFIEQRPFGNNSMGSPGVEYLRWLKPVRPGDTIRTVARVAETRTSKSRPEMGICLVDYEVLNQDDEVVVTMSATQFVRRRGQS